jgi:hypothetical protein
MSPHIVRMARVLVSIALFSGALHSALWVFSSASPAFQACGGRYSLFASTFRCRQPYVAGILSLTLFIAFIYSVYVTGKAERNAQRSEGGGK